MLVRPFASNIQITGLIWTKLGTVRLH